MSLAKFYCSITLSNYGALRLKRFVSQFTCKLCNWFLFYPHLVLNACVQIFDVKFTAIWNVKFNHLECKVLKYKIFAYKQGLRRDGSLKKIFII